MGEPIKLLNKVLDMIEGTGRNQLEAYEDLLHFMGYKLEIENVATPQMNAQKHDEILSLLDLDVLRQDGWDWIGEVYQTRGISNPRTGQFFTPKGVSDMMAALNQPQNPNPSEPERMLDPCVGSGRLILSMYNLVGKGLLYYGADIDKIAYRTALINMKLHDIPARIICCDSLRTELSPSSANWQYANMWEPPLKKRFILNEA